MAINLIIKIPEKEGRGPVSRSGIRQPSIRAFMDDMTVMTTRGMSAHWIIRKLDKIIEWAGMKFKPRKSRSVVIVKGKIESRYCFRIQGTDIPTIKDSAIKCLGKCYDETLNDSENVKRFKQQVSSGLAKIERSLLPGKYKLWFYQHGLLPRLSWPMLMYDIPVSTVESIQKTVNRWLQKWLGVPQIFSEINLYSTTCKLQLPLKSVVEEYKVIKAGACMTVRESKDDKIKYSGIRLKTGRKWDAISAVLDSESRLKHADVVALVCKGRHGFGNRSDILWSKASKLQRRELIKKGDSER